MRAWRATLSREYVVIRDLSSWICLASLGLCACAPSMWPLPAVQVGEHLFERRELANGLRAVAVKDAGADLSVFVVVGAGKRNETVSTTGLAHLVEHAMYTGTRKIKAGEHDQRIAEMGGESNAFTREDATFFYDHKIPPEHLDEVLGMEAQRLRGLQLPEEAVLAERERLRVEEQATWQPAEVRRQLLEAAAYRVHPYSVGVLDDSGHTAALRLGVPEIRSFYDRYYQPNETVVVVAGAVEPNAALDAIGRAFAPLRRGPSPPAIPEEPEVTEARDVEIPSQLSRDRVEWVWLGPAMGHPERPALHLLARVLSRRTSQEGVPFSASMGGRVDRDLFRIAATGEGAEQEIAALMHQLHEDSVSTAEAEEAKKLERERFTGLPLRARPYFSLALLFGAYEVAGHPQELSTYADRIDALSVSDLSQVLERRLEPGKRISIRFLGTGAEQLALPDDATELSREAMNAEDAGDFERAVDAYTKLLSQEPSKMNQVIYLAGRGQVRMQQLDYAAAIADFEWALSLVDYPAVRDLRDEARALLAGGVARRPDSSRESSEEEESEPQESDAGEHLDRLAEKLEGWRGLQFKQEVVPEYVDPAEAGEAKLAGWYDTDSDRLVIVRGGSEAFSQGALLHEMHHALQDQHWNLSALHDGVQSSDEARALAGLIEGEAMLAVSELLSYDFERHTQIPEKGPLERAKFEKIFNYGTGLGFVREIREQGGWAAVDEVWKNPPRSTAELFHPERYPLHETAEVGMGSEEGELLESDRRGEFELRWLLLRSEETRSAAVDMASALVVDGWQKRRLLDGSEREVWMLLFTDEASSERFVTEALQALDEEGWVARRQDRQVRLEREVSGSRASD